MMHIMGYEYNKAKEGIDDVFMRSDIRGDERVVDVSGHLKLMLRS